MLDLLQQSLDRSPNLDNVRIVPLNRGRRITSFLYDCSSPQARPPVCLVVSAAIPSEQKELIEMLVRKWSFYCLVLRSKVKVESSSWVSKYFYEQRLK